MSSDNYLCNCPIFDLHLDSQNQVWFQNIRIPQQSFTVTVISHTSFSSSLSTKSSNTSIMDFIILNNFLVQVHPPKSQLAREVLWCPHIRDWAKVNMDGVVCGSPYNSARGGIFRDHKGDHLGSFSCNLGHDNALFSEIMVVILALELDASHHWNRLWLKMDSSVVMHAFS